MRAFGVIVAISATDQSVPPTSTGAGNHCRNRHCFLAYRLSSSQLSVKKREDVLSTSRVAMGATAILLVSTNQHSVNTSGQAHPEPLSEQPADLHFPSPPPI